MKTVRAQYRQLTTTTLTTVPVRISKASCQPGVADVLATVKSPGVHPDDRRGRLPQLELPA
jgi:hypothetical protein